jgi:hypothetical protein
MNSVLYYNLKSLRFRDQLDALAEGRVAARFISASSPSIIATTTAGIAPIAPMTSSWARTWRRKDVIPRDKMIEIVDDIVSMGVKAVTFSGGGEPLLYKPLPEVIGRLAEGGVCVATLTNGSNLKAKVADALARHST